MLYYWGALQWLVVRIGGFLQQVIGTTACESLNAAANIFMGQATAPFLIKPYLSQLTLSEIHAVMTGGFATIAGTVLAAYVSFGVSASHLGIKRYYLNKIPFSKFYNIKILFPHLLKFQCQPQ